MIERFVYWFLSFLGIRRYEIGRRGDVYLVRWDLLGNRYGEGGKVFLHRFLRGDFEEALHDHPWSFWSLILWGGYWEVTESCSVKTMEGETIPPVSVKRWCRPLSLLKRPAEWRHRVALEGNLSCWTLVWTGPKKRHWGFWCPAGWRHWKEFVSRTEAGLAGCGEGS